MGAVTFTHPESSVGSISIDNGIDDIQWAYGLNTAVFPTYGGEVVQILSVYIDDLTIQGTLSTYKQLEAVYGYFARFMQVATQGNKSNPTPGQTSYNLQPMVMTYAERNWSFKIYPMSAPQFYYGADVIAPTWQMTAHVIDDSPDLDLIKNGIKALAVNQLISVGDGQGNNISINGMISPDQGNPDTDPFQTYDDGLGSAATQINNLANSYNALIPAYLGGDFSSLTGGLGSGPTLPTQNTNNQTTKGSTN